MSVRVRARRGIVVGVAVLAIVGTAVAAGSIDRGAAVTRRAQRVDPPEPAVVIGDSSIAALRWVPGADNAIVGFEHTLDLESCRRLYAESCYGREGRKPPTVFEALDFHAAKYHTLIVATGYNDGTSGFAESFDKVVTKARAFGYQRIVWYTLRSAVDYVSPGQLGNHETFARNNAVLRSLVASGRYPDVTIADWGRYSADEIDWFVTDGVHFRQLGAWAAADYATRKMAFIEGRACPLPTNPGAPVADPCPDPDVTGPVADIDALYDIGRDGVLCYEIGVEHRVECRYDTHVILLTRELRLGDDGDDVEALQVRLARLAVMSDPADGVFGPRTEAAVVEFQRSVRLDPTGVADVATLRALGFDTSAIVGATPPPTVTTTTTPPTTTTTTTTPPTTTTSTVSTTAPTGP